MRHLKADDFGLIVRPLRSGCSRGGASRALPETLSIRKKKTVVSHVPWPRTRQRAVVHWQLVAATYDHEVLCKSLMCVFASCPIWYRGPANYGQMRIVEYDPHSGDLPEPHSMPGGVHARFLDINLDELDPGPGTPVWYHHPKIRLQELISGVISSCYF